MGSAFSCKRKKKREEEIVVTRKTSNTNNRQQKRRPKQIVVDKDRKIIQKDKELYQVIFDAEGFSVHDLALLGLKNSPETLLRKNLRPRKMGRVDILNDIPLPPASSPKTPAKSSKKGLKTAQSPSSNAEFEVVEVLDYVDDLYLQLLDPDRTIMDGKESTSNTENASSK